MFYVSVVSMAEALRYPGVGDDEAAIMERFFGIVELIDVSVSIARTAAMIGRTRSRKLPDLLIAATALEERLPLITMNLRDFRSIPGLIVRSSV